MTVCLALLCLGVLAAEPLPRPTDRVPPLPPLQPAVITGAGQRLLLTECPVALRWDAAAGRLAGDRPGCWVINYPLDRIAGFEGQSADQIARRLFGRDAAAVRDWFVWTPGESAEPAAPTGPAPVVLHASTLVVDPAHPAAADTAAGTPAQPLRTIGAAVARAQAGDVVRVRPGLYREALKLAAGGTRERPIRLEGERDAAGRLPVITGNDPFPAGAWQPVDGLPGVWRADLFTGREGTVSLDGVTLVERSVPEELQPGECCLNRGSREFARLRLPADLRPRTGDRSLERTWRRVVADAEGWLDLAAAGPAENAVLFASTWVWVAPRPRPGVVWDPRFPQPVTGTVACGGPFRAARESGSLLGSQVNPYRVWVNGERLPAVLRSSLAHNVIGQPRPHRNYGKSDAWEAFPLREGWNHLVFQFDTTCQARDLRFRFGAPKGLDRLVTSADPPADPAAAPTSEPRPYLAEWLLLEPLPATRDRGVYVRLPGDADPNQRALDLAARGSTLVSLSGDFVEVRGFEIRHGAQFQQRAQVDLSGEGTLLEGCLVRDSEVKGLSFTCQKTQAAAPVVIRNNWVVNPGNVGIGGNGATDQLTAQTVDTTTPGRSPVLLEHNTIVNNNWACFPPFWESGGMKLFRLTGAVIRYNTIVGGSGPGIWLDWEHYGNRLEGNRFVDGWAIGIGIEASPGPNLVCNNLTVNLRPGPVWFRAAHLSWSTDRNWVLHNTVDGRWNELPAWQNKVGTEGVYLNEGGDDRGTRWGALTGRRQTMVNNVILGCQVALRRQDPDDVAGNLTDRGTGATALTGEAGFVASERLDYRLQPASPLAAAGVEHPLGALVTHDHLGLLRLPEDGRSVGAFRAAPRLPADRPVTEVEFTDGTMARR